MKKKNRNVNSFEEDLNQLETPPHRSMISNQEILIQTKNYLDKVFNQKLDKCSIHTQTIYPVSVKDNKSLVLDEERNLRSRTIDHFPLDLQIDSQLRTVEKKIKVKNCSQSKQNQKETLCTQTTTRRESTNSIFKKGILKNHSQKDELSTYQKRSTSMHSGKSVRFSLTNNNVRQLIMFGK